MSKRLITIRYNHPLSASNPESPYQTKGLEICLGEMKDIEEGLAKRILKDHPDNFLELGVVVIAEEVVEEDRAILPPTQRRRRKKRSDDRPKSRRSIKADADQTNKAGK